MDVSIIIVNYNNSDLVNDCIRSIFDNVKDIDYEIIVVDNNTEDLSEVIDSRDDHRVNLLQLPENIGFGRANNAGAKIAKGRNLFLLNPDTLLLNNAVKILSDYLDNHPECGACGGNLYTREQKPLHSYRKIMPGILDSADIALSRKLSRIIYGKSHEFNFSGEEMAVGYITGADLMVPAKIFNSVNGFNDRIFLYYEETDLCRRISDKGYGIVSVPSSKIIHLVGQSHKSKDRKKVNVLPYKYEGESRRIYLSSHNSKVSAGISRLILKAFFGACYLFSFIKNSEVSRQINKTRFISA